MNATTLTYPSQAAETAAEKLLTDHITYYTVDASCWRIKWRGEYIRTTSGKSAWKTIGHAKSAFKNHLRRSGLAWRYEQIVTNNNQLKSWEAKIKTGDFSN